MMMMMISVSWCSTLHDVGWSVREQSSWQTERHWCSRRLDSSEVIVQRPKSSPPPAFIGHSRPEMSFRHKIDCSAETVGYTARVSIEH